MSNVLEDLKLLQRLKDDNDYKHMRPLPGGCWACICQFMFTWAILTGKMHDYVNVADRWCYPNEKDAFNRHPATGRRVSTDGEEYINP